MSAFTSHSTVELVHGSCILVNHYSKCPLLDFITVQYILLTIFSTHQHIN